MQIKYFHPVHHILYFCCFLQHRLKCFDVIKLISFVLYDIWIFLSYLEKYYFVTSWFLDYSMVSFFEDKSLIYPELVMVLKRLGSDFFSLSFGYPVAPTIIY